MNPLKIARLVVVHSTSLGTGMFVGSIANHVMPKHPNRLLRGCQYMGLIGIAGLAGEKVADFAGEQFDDIAEIFSADYVRPTKTN